MRTLRVFCACSKPVGRVRQEDDGTWLFEGRVVHPGSPAWVATQLGERFARPRRDLPIRIVLDPTAPAPWAEIDCGARTPHRVALRYADAIQAARSGESVLVLRPNDGVLG